MGKGLYGENQCFTHYMNTMDKIVKNHVGWSVLDELYDSSRKYTDPFNQIRHSQPAIYMLEYALARTLMQHSIQPDFVLGASLGEAVALTVAGACTMEDCLICIIDQAVLFNNYCRMGGMLTILGHISLYHENRELHSHCEIAACDQDNHFIVSASEENLTRIETYLREYNIVYHRLPVQYAFHSALLDEIKPRFDAFNARLRLGRPSITLISSVFAQPMHSFPEDYLWKVYRQPINFRRAVEYLESRGAYDYIDVGPSGTLCGFVKHIKGAYSHSQCMTTVTPFTNNAGLEAILEGLVPCLSIS